MGHLLPRFGLVIAIVGTGGPLAADGSKNQVIPDFAPTAKTGVLLKPVNTKQYGWFLIQPLAATNPGSTTSESKAAPAIRKQLDATKAQQTASTWMTGIQKTYCSGGKIAYGTGYAPTPDPCATLSSPPPTTT